VTAAWIAVVLIAVGLPLLAWWWGGRRFWGRRDAAGRLHVDLRQQMRRRHGLSSADATLVEDAVQAGRALDDERLRAVAVDWAEQALADVRGRRGLPGGVRGFLVVFWAFYAVIGVATTVFSLATGDGVPWLFVLFTVNGLVGMAGPLMARRTLRRAIDRNSSTFPSADRP
jgi:hypothetical protein